MTWSGGRATASERWRGNGVLYVATGQRYMEEAVRSAHSVQQAMPGLPITILTDRPGVTPPGIGVQALPTPQMGIADKVSNLHRSPYERTLFLDTDTHVCGDLSDCFSLLADFDLLVAHDALRANRPNPDIEPAFPECNAGVIFFRRSSEAMACLETWKRLYDADCVTHGARQMPDQFSFRQALRTSPLRLYVLPPECHCMTWEASFLNDPVRVLHGRHDLPLDVIATEANAVTGPRIFKAGLGAHRVHLKPDVVAWSARVVAAQLMEAVSSVGGWFQLNRSRRSR